MIKKRLSILFTSALAVLALSACDNGDGAGKYPSRDNVDPTPIPDGPTPTPEPGVEPTPEPSTVTITGAAAKGLVIGGVVNIHPIINGVLNTTPLNVTTPDSNLTGNDGTYSVTVDNYTGNPFVVRVTTGPSTTMVCDLAGGCDGQPFGSSIPITDTDFNLDAVVPPVTSNQATVNLSALTSTATQVALNDIGNLSDANIDAIATAVNAANSSVANRFGVIGQLTSLPVVDLTNPSSLAGIAQEIIEYNLLSVGIVEALLTGDSSVSIANAVSAFATQYVDQGGMADREESETTTVTLAEILAQASQVLGTIQGLDGATGLDLERLATLITNNQALAEIGSTDPSAGDIPDDVNATELELVKGMVTDIRTLASVNFTDSEQFVDDVEVATETFDADVGAHLQALAWAVEAMVAAGSAYDGDNTLTSHTDENTGIAVGISAGEGEVTYSIEETAITVGEGDDATQITVDLDAVDTGSQFTGPEAGAIGKKTSATEDSSGEVALALTGTTSSSEVMLTISEGELTAAGSLTQVDTDGIPLEGLDMTGTEDTAEASVSAFDLAAAIKLEELEGENPVSFDGTLNLDIDGLAINTSESTSYVSSGDTVTLVEEWSQSVGFEELTFIATGTFSSSAGDNSLAASLSITATPEGMVYNCHNGDGSAGQEKTCTEESESEYLGLSFSVMVGIEDTDLVDDISVIVSGTRSGVNDADLVVRVESGSTMLQFNYATASLDNEEQSVSITNQSGAVLSVERTMVDNEYEVSGSIVLNEVEYATIEELRNFIVIRYNDGLSETF